MLLRPVRVADAPTLAALDSEAKQLTGTRTELSLEELERWYATRAEYPQTQP